VRKKKKENSSKIEKGFTATKSFKADLGIVIPIFLGIKNNNLQS